MNDSTSPLACLRDPRIATHAVAAAPAWLWSADGTRIVWANAVGAAIFQASSPAALRERRFDAADPVAAQIARIGAALPPDRVPRLERLSGLEGARGLACGCSRITSPDGSAAILIVAAEAAGPTLTLDERVQRLIADIDAPVAIFTAEGALFHANHAAAGQLAAAATLQTLGADALATHALRAGFASGVTTLGTLSFDRIGNDAATFVLTTLPAKARSAAQPFASATAPSQEADVFAPETIAAVVAGENVTGGDKQPAAPVFERRQPLRFVWQMDSETRFTIESEDFIRLAGPCTAQALGQPWAEIVRRLGIDPNGDVTRALATRDTWSGITINWPVDGTDEKLVVELSGLPAFDRERHFGGYRGFGVCRNARRISTAPSLREPAATPEAKPDEAVVDERPILSIVPQAENVVPFRAAATDKGPALSPVEHSAFHELAKELTNRLQQPKAKLAEPVEEVTPEPAPEDTPADERSAMGFIPRGETVEPPRAMAFAPQPARDDRAIIDRLPMGVLVYRLEMPLYANAAFLQWSGYDSVMSLATAGGLDVLYVELGEKTAASDGQPLRVTSDRGKKETAEGRLFTAPWEDEVAHVLMLLPPAAAMPAATAVAPASAPAAEAQASEAAALRAAETELRDFKAILDTAGDGVLLLNDDGRVLAANAGAQALFGRDAATLTGSNIDDLIALESQRAALEYLAALVHGGPAPKKGCEIIGRGHEGNLLPLYMTLGRLGDDKRYCAVLRDLTSWKKTEMELVTARRQAEKASSAKSEFLAKVSHEIRTPLNSIIGFSEVMMDERFGAIGNERYKQYLKDIHESGGHLVSLLNDLLDLSKIEAGKLDLSFGRVSLNEVTQQCVSLMQPQANHERVIIRTSLPAVLPPIMADVRSLRQIVINLLSNSIKFTGAGGQVIVSTTHTDDGEVVLRVRDTGHGMTDKEIQMALEPFRQLSTSSRWGSGGTGLGLPLTKALTEANRANFTIKSAVNAGTLVEIAFPRGRVLVA